MRYYLPVVVAVAGLGWESAVVADGLIFQLPADGVWARYAYEAEGAMTIGEFTLPIAITGTSTISSVGKVKQNRETYRWIELKSESESEEVYPRLILKMRIPEKRLQRGQDPLAHSVQTFFDPKPMDEKKAPSFESFIDDGFNRIQYEIDRFRPDFPKPLNDVKTLNRETVETPAGRFEDCEVITGTSGYDGPLVLDGRSVYRGTYRITIHPRAPFGVVALSMESTGREIGDDQVAHVTFKKSLTLVATGVGAVSALPERP
jgi:hypothetical protein